MQIVIPLEGRVRTVIRSSFVAAKRLAESQYALSGDNFQMTGVTAEQVLILPDTVGVSEGQTVTDEMKMQALPFEGFIAVSAEETLPAVLGLLLRSAVADGKLTDEELLSVQPALEGRVWQPGISVQVASILKFIGLFTCLAQLYQSCLPAMEIMDLCVRLNLPTRLTSQLIFVTAWQ